MVRQLLAMPVVSTNGFVAFLTGWKRPRLWLRDHLRQRQQENERSGGRIYPYLTVSDVFVFVREAVEAERSEHTFADKEVGRRLRSPRDVDVPGGCLISLSLIAFIGLAWLHFNVNND